MQQLSNPWISVWSVASFNSQTSKSACLFLLIVPRDMIISSAGSWDLLLVLLTSISACVYIHTCVCSTMPRVASGWCLMQSDWFSINWQAIIIDALFTWPGIHQWRRNDRRPKWTYSLSILATVKGYSCMNPMASKSISHELRQEKVWVLLYRRYYLLLAFVCHRNFV